MISTLTKKVDKAESLKTFDMTAVDMDGSKNDDLLVPEEHSNQGRRKLLPLCRSTTSTYVTTAALEKVKLCVRIHSGMLNIVAAFQISKFNLATVSLLIPHPKKKSTGGEDALFATSTNIGVYDGVGGWNDRGIDPGPYARKMAALTKKFARENPGACPKEGAKYAVRLNKLDGSTTVCHVALHGGALQAVNVGDSGFVLFRRGRQIFASQNTMHGFNHPCQVRSKNTKYIDRAKVLNVAIEEGDVIICATDGLWDNVFLADIRSAVKRHHKRSGKQRNRTTQAIPSRSAIMKGSTLLKRAVEIIRGLARNTTPKDKESEEQAHMGATESLRALATDLGTKACNVASSSNMPSPFAEKSKQHGKPHKGGKMDDISLIVAMIRSSHHTHSNILLHKNYP